MAIKGEAASMAAEGVAIASAVADALKASQGRHTGQMYFACHSVPYTL